MQDLRLFCAAIRSVSSTISCCATLATTGWKNCFRRPGIWYIGPTVGDTGGVCRGQFFDERHHSAVRPIWYDRECQIVDRWRFGNCIMTNKGDHKLWPEYLAQQIPARRNCVPFDRASVSGKIYPRGSPRAHLGQLVGPGEPFSSLPGPFSHVDSTSHRLR